MITAQGYSKDPNIPPEGIVVTFGQQMIGEQGGLLHFIRGFEAVMNDDNDYWIHTLSNFPTLEQDIVYLIVANRLYGRVYCGGYCRNHDANITGYGMTGEQKLMDKPFLILSGPLTRCPFKRTLKGFQGFRYCTKLF